MNSEALYLNRIDAGRRLVKPLEKYRGQNAVVLALPRGGVVTAKTIAKELNLPLGIVVIRKIGHPVNSEYGIAAISENGEIVKNEEEVANVDQNWFQEESRNQLGEARRRRQKYWGNRKPINIMGKTAIIIDDGLATGLTMIAAIKEVKSQDPGKIIVAVPVSPPDTADKIKAMVDEFIADSIPEPFFEAIGTYYEVFPQVTDEEVIELLKDDHAKAAS